MSNKVKCRNSLTKLNLNLCEERKGGVKKSLLFVISGPSGSGKTTLARRLLSWPDFKNHLVKSISFTTRPKRRGEKVGRDYRFLKKEEFILKRKNKKLLEWTEYLGHFYGTEKRTIDSLLESKKDILLCLDTKGALKVKRIYPEAILIFILPPSIEVLKERLERRPKEKYFSLVKRLQKARQEINLAERYDYKIINDRIEIALQELKELILKERWAINP